MLREIDKEKINIYFAKWNNKLKEMSPQIKRKMTTDSVRRNIQRYFEYRTLSQFSLSLSVFNENQHHQRQQQQRRQKNIMMFE